MEIKKITPTAKAYYRDGNLVAIATNPGWGGDGVSYSDAWTNYFCLPDVWEQDSQTTWVDEEDLAAMLPKSA